MQNYKGKTMKKPIIGIPAKQPEINSKDLWRRMEVVDDIRYLITKHGGISIMLLPSENTMDFNQSDLGDDTVLSDEEIADLHRQVDLCDGIVLQGGLYSCEYEVEIARYALKKDIPIIGICAGFNNILRAIGSNVYEDDNRYHNRYDKDYRHPIKVIKGTKLYDIIGSEEYEVNSLHTMMADFERVEPYATISAYDNDIVEAFELDNKKYVLAIKWHPEIMKDEEYADRLFGSFIKACTD